MPPDNSSEIDLIISCQAGLPDYLVWQTAGKVQHQLNATNASFVDFYQGCCSFVAAMRYAKNTLIAEDAINNVLVCTGEKWENVIRNRAVGGYVFSDGACAAVLSRDCRNNVIKGFGSTGRGGFNSVSKMDIGRLNGFNLEDTDAYYYDIRKETPSEILEDLKMSNLKTYLNTANKALLDAGYTLNDIDFIIFPSGRFDFTHKLIKAFNIEKERTNYKYIAELGDTSTADAMLNYQLLLNDKIIRKNDLVLILTQGAGMSWASIIIQV